MMHKPPPYTRGIEDRYGKWRWYYRRPGYKSVRLPGLPWSPTFMEAYEAAGKGEQPKDAIRSKPGTVAALVESYLRSSQYKNLKPLTKRTYHSTIEPFRVNYGEKSVANLERKHINAIISKYADRPNVANTWLKTIKILMAHAVESGMRADNPTIGIRKLRTGSTGYRTWNEDEIAQYLAAHPVGSKARLAIDLFLYTGQRRADVVRMGWQNVRGDVLTVKQSKTGTLVELQIHPTLQASLDALPDRNMMFLVTEAGKSFSIAGFGNRFQKWCIEAKLPTDLSAHGLRKAACRRLAELGCSAPMIMAISGHRNLREVQTYIDGANRLGLARDALKMQMIADGTGTNTVKLGDQV